jgi:hypothetical protein
MMALNLSNFQVLNHARLCIAALMRQGIARSISSFLFSKAQYGAGLADQSGSNLKENEHGTIHLTQASSDHPPAPYHPARHTPHATANTRHTAKTLRESGITVRVN